MGNNVFIFYKAEVDGDTRGGGGRSSTGKVTNDTSLSGLELHSFSTPSSDPKQNTVMAPVACSASVPRW